MYINKSTYSFEVSPVYSIGISIFVNTSKVSYLEYFITINYYYNYNYNYKYS